MKHTILVVMVLAVSLPATFINPFVGVAVYYGFATLFPQHLWAHALPQWRWSLIIGLATVASFILHGFARSRAGVRWPIEKKLIAILGGLTVLSVIDAVDPDLAYRQLDDYLKLFIMFFIACAVLDSRHRLRVLAIVVVACLGWVAFDFNQRYVFMGQKDPLNRGFASIDNNGVAALMVMGMPFCLFLFAQERKWYLKWPPLAAMVLMMHVVLFSMSRGGVLGMIFTLPILLLRMRRRWIGVALTVVAAVVGLRLAGKEVRQRFSTIQSYDIDASAQIRLSAWRTSVEIIRDHPVLGVGPNCFRRVVGQYSHDIKGRTVHNRIIQTAVDMGLLAALALVGALVLSLIHLQMLRWRHRQDPFVYDLANCLQVCLLGYIAVGMFVSIGTFELPYIALAMAVGLRNVVAVEEPEGSLVPTPAQRRKARRWLTGAAPATT